MRRMVRTISVFATFAIVAFLPFAAQAEANKPVNAKEAFEKLKGLAGEWRGTEGEKGKGMEMTVLYKTTSHGSAVVETLFPGTDHEMITVFHLEGDRLVLTHYCAIGNQPKMALSKKATADHLVFDFIGGSNVNPKDDLHMHSARFQLEGKDSFSAEWDTYQGGKKTDTKKFFLTRKS